MHLSGLSLPDRPVIRANPGTVAQMQRANGDIRDLIEAQGAVPNIPAKSNRKWKPCFSKALYRERNQVERFFIKFRYFRRVVTRYDKLAESFLAWSNSCRCASGCALMNLRPGFASILITVSLGS